MDLVGLEITPVDPATLSGEIGTLFFVNHRKILGRHVHYEEVAYSFQSKGLRVGRISPTLLACLAPYGDYCLSNTPFVMLYVTEDYVANGGKTCSNKLAKELAVMGNQTLNYCYANTAAVSAFFRHQSLRDNCTTLYYSGVTYLDGDYLSIVVGYGSDGPVILTSEVSHDHYNKILECLHAQRTAVETGDLLPLLSGL
jgi:hypothetical protein